MDAGQGTRFPALGVYVLDLRLSSFFLPILCFYAASQVFNIGVNQRMNDVLACLSV